MSKLNLAASVVMLALLFNLTIQASFAHSSTPPGRDFSGVVYADAGSQVAGAIVSASGSEGSGSALTDSLGHYVINEGLKTGNYTVSVVKEGYLNAKKDNVSVVVGNETLSVNFQLNLSGGISGKVTEAGSNNPLANMMITASISSGREAYGWSTLTNASGYYRIFTNLATGTYNITAIFPEGYIMKSIGEIQVTADLEVTGKDLTLEQSGTISGKVTATPTGTPLAKATVYANTQGSSYLGMTETDAFGYYRISSGLGTGTYAVTATYQNTYVGHTTGVNVTASVETPNADVAIPFSPQRSGIITGRITDNTDGKPITNAFVKAQGAAGAGEAYTDTYGVYVISSGLGNGSYSIIASAAGYQTRNTTVAVVVDVVKQNIDFQLFKIPHSQSGIISGTVQNETEAVPEFQYQMIFLLIATFAAVMLIRSIHLKSRRLQHR